MYVHGKYLTKADDLREVFQIRRAVFIEEQGVSEDIEFDDDTIETVYVLVYDENEKAVGTGRIFQEDDYTSYHIGRICVLREARGQQFGDMIVRMLINKAVLCGGKLVSVGAQKQAVRFYEKIGFQVCGEEYEEAGIAHLPMELKLKDFCTKCESHNC